MAAHAKKKVVKKAKPKKSRKVKRIGRALPAVDAAKAIADTVNAGSKAFDVFWKGEPLGIMKRPEFRAFGGDVQKPRPVRAYMAMDFRQKGRSDGRYERCDMGKPAEGICQNRRENLLCQG